MNTKPQPAARLIFNAQTGKLEDVLFEVSSSKEESLVKRSLERLLMGELAENFNEAEFEATLRNAERPAREARFKRKVAEIIFKTFGGRGTRRKNTRQTSQIALG